MNAALSLVLDLEDQIELNQIARELEDPNISTERLFEMLAQATEMARRYALEVRFGNDY
jgi:hypothetical protein